MASLLIDVHSGGISWALITLENTFLLLLVLVFACAGYTSHVADSKGHDSASWFVGGFFFGPLALLASLGLPDLTLRRYLRLLAEQGGAMRSDGSSIPSDWGDGNSPSPRLD